MSDSSVLGGPYNGHSSKQTVTSKRDGESAITRKILRSSWNTPYATGTYAGEKRVTTPFRAVNNLGDFLSRKNYSCGGPDMIGSGNPFIIRGSINRLKLPNTKKSAYPWVSRFHKDYPKDIENVYSNLKKKYL